MRTEGSGSSMSRRSTSWVWISGIAFLLSLLVSCMLIFFGKRLEDLGITGNIYYIVLVPLGLACAAFLAGAMRSYASYKSNSAVPYGSLRLSGPIVIFILVVGGGFIMPNLNKKAQFNVKLRIVSKEKSTSEFNEGFVVAYIGDEKMQANIRDGVAELPNVPISFYHKTMRIEVNGLHDFRLSGPQEVQIEKGFIDLPVSRTEASLATVITGSIADGKGAPVPDALLDFESGLATCQTDAKGDFKASVPLPEGKNVRLRVFVKGILRFNESVTLSSTIPNNIMLNSTP